MNRKKNMVLAYDSYICDIYSMETVLYSAN